MLFLKISWYELETEPLRTWQVFNYESRAQSSDLQVGTEVGVSLLEFWGPQPNFSHSVRLLVTDTLECRIIRSRVACQTLDIWSCPCPFSNLCLITFIELPTILLIHICVHQFLSCLSQDCAHRMIIREGRRAATSNISQYSNIFFLAVFSYQVHMSINERNSNLNKLYEVGKCFRSIFFLTMSETITLP